MTPEPEVLDEIGQLYMNELDKLPLQDLDRMIKQVTAAKDTAALYLNALQSTLHSRLGGHAQQPDLTTTGFEQRLDVFGLPQSQTAFSGGNDDGGLGGLGHGGLSENF